MIYILYLIAAAIIVYLSNKASVYVDLLDKKTSLSGAFIGGVMLSAVTSLPELFTSISSTVFLNKPGLCLGNILGSNLFNLTTIAVLILIFFKGFKNANIAKSHLVVAVTVFFMYVFMVLNWLNILNFEIATVSITSLAIIILYIFGVKNMAGDDSANNENDDSELTVKQISVRFVLVSIGIIIISILITYITDEISERLNLGAGLAGALFLGIATSLPELASTTALFKIKNYNIAIGNIIGSNLFNFTILFVSDILYFKNNSSFGLYFKNDGIYNFAADPKNINLLIFGALASLAIMFMFKFKNKYTQAICSGLIIACYIAFLVI